MARALLLDKVKLAKRNIYVKKKKIILALKSVIFGKGRCKMRYKDKNLGIVNIAQIKAWYTLLGKSLHSSCLSEIRDANFLFVFILAFVCFLFYPLSAAIPDDT